MRYGYRCPEHGEFELNRPMSEASLPGICRTCFKPAPRYYGRHPVTVIVPRSLHEASYYDIIPKPSDFEYRGEYEKAIENISWRSSPPSSSERVLTQRGTKGKEDRERRAEKAAIEAVEAVA